MLVVLLGISGSVACARRKPAAHVRVSIKALAFSPSTITVTRGDTVTWTNADIVQHTVTMIDGTRDSGALLTGADYSWVSDVPGVFAYQCAYHPSMQGRVEVRP